MISSLKSREHRLTYHSLEVPSALLVAQTRELLHADQWEREAVQSGELHVKLAQLLVLVREYSHDLLLLIGKALEYGRRRGCLLHLELVEVGVSAGLPRGRIKREYSGRRFDHLLFQWSLNLFIEGDLPGLFCLFRPVAEDIFSLYDWRLD